MQLYIIHVSFHFIIMFFSEFFYHIEIHQNFRLQSQDIYNNDKEKSMRVDSFGVHNLVRGNVKLHTTLRFCLVTCHQHASQH